MQVFTKYGFVHNKCFNCGTLYCSPCPTESQLSIFYNTFYSPKLWTAILLKSDEDRKKVQYRPRVETIVSFLKGFGQPRLNVAVDLGAGAGNFAVCLEETGYFNKIVCLELSADCVEICGQKGFDSRAGGVEILANGFADIILMNDLIEHVYDPGNLLKTCFSKLSDNGFLTIATPNCQGFDFILLDEKTGNITPPEHLNYFTPGSLEILLKASGFDLVHMSTPGKLDVEIIKKEMDKGFRIEKENKFLHVLY